MNLFPLFPGLRLGLSSFTPSVLLLACGTLLFAPFAFAADPSAKDAPTAEVAVQVDASPYAPRELKFRILEEPLALQLTDLDPKLLEQRFVASVRLEGTLEGTDGILNRAISTSPDGIKTLIDATPENLRPAKEILELLQVRGPAPTKASAGRAQFGQGELLHVRHTLKRVRAERSVGTDPTLRIELGGAGAGINRTIRSPDGNSRRLEGAGFIRATHEFAFLAPTAEQAKSLAEAFLVIYDQGLALPARKTVAQWKGKDVLKPGARTADLEAARLKSSEATKAWELAKSIEGLGNEAVAELSKKQLLLRVEQVGVSARVSALETKIAEKRRAGIVPENMVALKESAEIDLAGLTGQLNEIERLLRGSKKRIDALQQANAAGQSVTAIQKELELDRLELAVYEEDYRATAPYELADKGIPVQPIAWTPPK